MLPSLWCDNSTSRNPWRWKEKSGTPPLFQGTKANSNSPLGSPIQETRQRQWGETHKRPGVSECSPKERAPATGQRPAIIPVDPTETSGQSVAGHELQLTSGIIIGSRSILARHLGMKRKKSCDTGNELTDSLGCRTGDPNQKGDHGNKELPQRARILLQTKRKARAQEVKSSICEPEGKGAHRKFPWSSEGGVENENEFKQ